MNRKKNNRKSIWDDPWTRVIQDLGFEGFTIATIARVTDMHVGQVMYRLGRMGISTMEVRRGEDKKSKERIKHVMNRHDHRVHPVKRRSA